MSRYVFIKRGQEETCEFPDMVAAAEYAQQNQYSIIIRVQGEGDD